MNMKAIYESVLDKLAELPAIQYTDRNRGQIDKYENRPAVKFPCALVSISLPKRKNLDSRTQLCNARIIIRLAFDRLQDASSISSASRRAQALAYYDTVEAAEALFQGFTGAQTSPWECTSAIDEERPDMDIVRFTFETTFVKEI